MIPFLQQVAKAYLANEREEMIDYCFVFPNKRSGVFFRHYLTEEMGGDPFIMPEIATIAEVTASFSALAPAPRLDQLFILYNEYRALSDDIASFDQFLFWGDMLLSDFNDVDRYLVDPHKLFVNLKRFREVSANYLTDEQREIISRYWGEQFIHHSPDEFWNHIHHQGPTELETKFLKLWEVLDPLFENFKKRLLDCGMATEGMFARNAVNYLTNASTGQLPYRRYIFVGFNVLTLSEIKIFEKLQARGIADFYWDMAAPTFRAEGNRAARFMRHNVECFPSRYDIAGLYPIPPGQFPKVHITGVPSSFGQTKAAGAQLNEWIEQGIINNPADATNTAVVLPDEALFIPMIHAVPTAITALNVTMGFPMKNTSFASFISAIVSMHLRSTFSKGICQYFYEDIKAVITHPLLQRFDSNGCNAVMKLLLEKRLYMVPADKIAETIPEMAFIFTPIADTNGIEEVYGYFMTLTQRLLDLVTADEANSVEKFFLQSYRIALDELKTAADRWSISMKDTTFIQLLQRTIASVSINFTGEPLKGMQIMGVLETRVLDFDNLIMLSMNERVFPRKHYSRSFIPDTLRRSYGMATTDFQESIYAYYFYRLISRASHVRLYYDARTLSGKNSEMSRYIAQLLYLFPQCEVIHDLAAFSSGQLTEEAIAIEKTPEIMDKLREFTFEKGGRTLSASSINDYINCPLSFYLKRICRLDLDEEIIDYMDSGTYGSILHEVAERIYKGLRGNNDEVKITPEILDHIISDNVKLDRIITELINEKYNRYPKGDTTPLVGESKVLGHVMRHFLKLMFREEKKIAPFDFIDGERQIIDRMRIADDLTININQIIDRIDRVYPEGKYGEPMSGTLRIVDYKTGSDKITFTSIDQLFDPADADRRKAVLQLMFYCNAFAQHTGYTEAIKPQIYLFRTLSTQGLPPLRFNKKPFEDYREINEEFMQRFRDVIKEMFDPAVPFTQALNDHSCTFCSFKAICRKDK